MLHRSAPLGLLALAACAAGSPPVASVLREPPTPRPVALQDCPDESGAEHLLNGDFELHAASEDQVNLPNAAFNEVIRHAHAFFNPAGNGVPEGALDLVTSGQFGGTTAQSGQWYLSLTPGGSDAIALQLCRTLTTGQPYTVSFWVRTFGTYRAAPVMVGVSRDPEELGELLYTSPETATGRQWVQYTFTLTGAAHHHYLTVTTPPNQSSDLWTQVDHFSVTALAR
jgi:hypothetical protein